MAVLTVDRQIGRIGGSENGRQAIRQDGCEGAGRRGW